MAALTVLPREPDRLGAALSEIEERRRFRSRTMVAWKLFGTVEGLLAVDDVFNADAIVARLRAALTDARAELSLLDEPETNRTAGDRA